MHTATLLSLQDEIEKIAENKQDYDERSYRYLKGGALLGSISAGKNLPHGATPSKALTNMAIGIGSGALGGVGLHKYLYGHRKEKKSGLGAGALDMAGLGMLAAPTIQKMRGKPMSDKNKDRAELGGLGVLGGSVAAEHAKDAVKAGKTGLSKLKSLASKFPKHAASI